MGPDSTTERGQSKLSERGGRLSFGGIVLGLSTIAVCAKVFGFAEKVVIAHFFGTSDSADVYFAATGAVLSIAWLVRELVYPTLLPVFADSLSDSVSASGGLFRKTFLSTAGLLAVVAFFLFFFSGLMVGIIVPGFSEQKQETAAGLLRALAPAVLFLGLTMVTYTVLNARKRFLRAAIPEALLKLFVVAGLLLLLPVFGLYALAVVFGAGGAGLLLAQLHFIPERTFLWKRGGGRRRETYFGKVLMLMGPLVVGVVFSHISGLVDTVLASTLPEGQLSYLGYSKRLLDAILLVGPVALTTVVYSHLSHLASAGDLESFSALVSRVLRLLVYLTVPACGVLVGLREPLIRTFFERGRFGADSSFGTSQAFMVYALGLTTFSVEGLLVHSFFALSDTKTPVKFGVLCVFLDIFLAVLLLKPLQYLGIAGALVISKTIKIVILGGILNSRLKGVFARMAGFLFKSAAIAAGVWMTVKLLLGIEHPDSFLLSAVFDLLVPAGGAVGTFVLVSYLLKVDELGVFVLLLKRKKSAIGMLYGGAR